jgi:hypothetical protein
LARERRGNRRFAFCLAILLAVCVYGTGSAQAAGLLDNRGWEMVSPVEKNGGAVVAPGSLRGGGVIQAAAGGGAATFSSSASFEAAQGAPYASQYISRRGSSGWVTQNVTPSTLSGAYGPGPEGVPYQLFSPDLARALMLDGSRCGEGEPCPRGYSLMEPPGSVSLTSPAEPDLRLAGATADLSDVVLQTCAALTAEALEEAEGEGCDPADTNLYEWSDGGLNLINASGGEILPAPFGHLAAGSGAISEDGSRVYWYQLEEGPIRLYEEGRSSKELPDTTGSEAVFQTASADGSVAFYAVGGILFRYSASSGTSGQIATGVEGVLGASRGGSVIYYQTAAGLFRWDEGTGTEIAAGAEAAEEGDYPPATGTARVSAPGSQLLFLSTERLTGYDNADRTTGLPDSEVFLWSAEGGLTCLSCNPTGARPLGSSTIPGAFPNGAGEGATDSYKPRALSASGRRVFFDSEDALLPQDTDAAADVYEWEADGEGSCQAPGGCLGLISAGDFTAGATFADASESGSDAYFLTAASLVGVDSGAVDLYDAREGGGFPEASVPGECEGDACQSLPPEPEDVTPGTLLPGAANPPVQFAKTKADKRHACKKGFSRRHGKCVRETVHRGKQGKRHPSKQRRRAAPSPRRSP